MLSRRNPQLNAHGELIHLLSIEGLPQAVLTQILDTAGTFLSVNEREVKKVPLLRGKSVFNLFFENSTRTPISRRSPGTRVLGPTARISAAPSVVSAWMSLRATRECTMSPTTATVSSLNSRL